MCVRYGSRPGPRVCEETLSAPVQPRGEYDFTGGLSLRSHGDPKSLPRTTTGTPLKESSQNPTSFQDPPLRTRSLSFD